ncbi:Uncharacterised protein [Mycobacterium tuberculosis]|nr:Uncharacterised protein [Mycobacterium tuberculosis]
MRRRLDMSRGGPSSRIASVRCSIVGMKVVNVIALRSISSITAWGSNL